MQGNNSSFPNHPPSLTSHEGVSQGSVQSVTVWSPHSTAFVVLASQLSTSPVIDCSRYSAGRIIAKRDHIRKREGPEGWTKLTGFGRIWGHKLTDMPIRASGMYAETSDVQKRIRGGAKTFVLNPSTATNVDCRCDLALRAF